MKKKIVLSGIVLAIAIALAVLFAANPFSGESKPNTVASTLLCRELPPEEIDFTILNDIYASIKESSVFRATADDPQTLYRGGAVAVFKQLGVPESQIPRWVWGEIDQRIATGSIDFTVFQRIYERLRDDPQYQNDPAYQDLRNP